MDEFIRRLDTLSGGFMRTQTLVTALRGGLFALLTTPHTADEVAALLGWDRRAARILLDGLLAMDLLVKESGAYRNAPIAEACLAPDAPYDQRHIILHRANAWDAWAKLGETMRTGRPAAEVYQSPEETDAFIRGMHDISRLRAPELVRAFELGPRRSLLDVGGGPGAYAMAFLDAYPKLHATIFDRPEVIRIARDYAEKAGLLERMRFHSGDFTRDPLPAGYDAVLVSNVVHGNDPDANRALVRKCFDALEPGGVLLIKDFLVDTEHTGPSFSLFFALQMLVTTEGGDVYSADDAAAWTEEAGFLPGRLVDMTPQTRIWRAEKPLP
jgi:SAM-dependent methyltransferase